MKINYIDEVSEEKEKKHKFEDNANISYFSPEIT